MNNFKSSWEKESLYVKIGTSIFAIFFLLVIGGFLIETLQTSPIVAVKFLAIILGTLLLLGIIGVLYKKFRHFRNLTMLILNLGVCYIIFAIFGIVGLAVVVVPVVLFIAFTIISQIISQNKILNAKEIKTYEKALRLHNFELAIQSLEQYLSTHKLTVQHQQSVYALCNTYLYLKQYDKALEVLDRFSEPFQDKVSKINIEFWKLAITCKKEDCQPEQFYSKFNEIDISKIADTKTKEFFNIQKLIGLARLDLKLDKIDDAKAKADSIPKTYHENNLYLLKAEIYKKMQDYSNALDMYLAALGNDYNTLTVFSISKEIQNCLQKLEQ